MTTPNDCHISLCSGIGGLELGLGTTPDVFAEINPAPASVLAEHFPDVPNIGDWTELDNFNDYTLITGGLPCQPLSGAGKGLTDGDPRYLFDDFVRILRSSDVRPTIVLENVRGILYPRNARPFWRLISALADLGYLGEWEVVRASDVGAPHKRERWFCVARHADNRGGEPENTVTRPAPAAFGHAIPFVHSSSKQAKPEGFGWGDTERRSLSTLRSSKYGPAVRRWEQLTRPCPPPLDDRGRLGVPFVEWVMGFPEGWVSILGRTAALKALGNAVLPQQARLAIDVLNPDRG